MKFLAADPSRGITRLCGARKAGCEAERHGGPAFSLWRLVSHCGGSLTAPTAAADSESAPTPSATPTGSR